MSSIKIGESKVIESRESQDGTMIRRRRVSLDGNIALRPMSVLSALV